MKLKHFFLLWFLSSVPAVGFLYAIRPASANLPSTKWGTQYEIGTVGDAKVIKVVDESLTCIVLQPRNTNAGPTWNCWGSP